MCVTNRHDMTLSVKVALNHNTTNQLIENIVGKGENARYQHFLLFRQCFLPFPNQILLFHSHLYI